MLYEDYGEDVYLQIILDAIPGTRRSNYQGWTSYELYQRIKGLEIELKRSILPRDHKHTQEQKRKAGDALVMKLKQIKLDDEDDEEEEVKPVSVKKVLSASPTGSPEAMKLTIKVTPPPEPTQKVSTKPVSLPNPTQKAIATLAPPETTQKPSSKPIAPPEPTQKVSTKPVPPPEPTQKPSVKPQPGLSPAALFQGLADIATSSMVDITQVGAFRANKGFEAVKNVAENYVEVFTQPFTAARLDSMGFMVQQLQTAMEMAGMDSSNYVETVEKTISELYRKHSGEFRKVLEERLKLGLKLIELHKEYEQLNGKLPFILQSSIHFGLDRLEARTVGEFLPYLDRRCSE